MEEEEEEEEEEEKKVWALCGLGYWVQGFRCFPWLALNFHMVHGLRLSPSTLQLVQSTANLPLVAKPLFGVISDAIYIGGAHRIPYISIGVFLQIIAWGALALIPATGETFPAQMACILLTNLGASLTEVVSDALTAEFSRAQYAGAMFYFQTQCLNLDPSIIGLSKVFGQLVVLSATILYNRYLKRIPMRKLIFGVQMVYGLALLSDLVLVKQINLKLGISNEVYVLCLSALAEAVAQFKILPFTVLLTSLCPPGCECSLFAFFASALCLSSILGGILGVGLASIIGVSSRDHSSLPLGIILQCMASLVPLRWISQVPNVQNMERVKKKMRDKYLGEPELFP
ncbi:hypothetical protein J5N97_001537 [Dioscorea zingiberensis]|uniref:Uncharacterized protein n=1 Tax=Dioscorea zingiberensis TaxID=325984 RepID=A0A9D5BVC7_9LILI|nr:hypothetical protein J5N97_001537 [Dioscorea zingiberensis]